MRGGARRSHNSSTGVLNSNSPLADATAQAPVASSPSSWPPPQPAYPLKTRKRSVSSFSDCVTRSKQVASPEKIPGARARCLSGSASSSAASAHSGWPCSMIRPGEGQGPPTKMGQGNPLACAGRLITSPNAPSALWASKNTTVRLKFASCKIGLAMRKQPAYDMMPPLQEIAGREIYLHSSKRSAALSHTIPQGCGNLSELVRRLFVNITERENTTRKEILMAQQTPLHEQTTAAGAAFIEEAGFLVPAHFG